MSEKEVKGYLATIQPELQKYSVMNYDEKTFMRSAILAISDNPGLAKAVSTPQGKTSLYNALKYAATTGLSLNPMEGKAALIPYGDKVQYQIMKSGMIELAMSTGKVAFITSDTVRENDTWRMKKTSAGDDYEFEPARRGRGQIDGVFAACRLVDGTTHVKYMDIDQVEEHKKKYSAKTQMPIEGYAIKTVLKAMLRGLNIAPEIDAAVGADDASEYEQSEPRDVSPQKGTTADDVADALKAKKEEKSADPDPEEKQQAEKEEPDDNSLF